MKTPVFWAEENHPYSKILKPISYAWHLSGIVKQALIKQRHTPLPSICIGNITVGGAGKTPATMAIAHYLAELGCKPAIISRGYGRKNPSAILRVNPSIHTAEDVGDEALLLAQAAPTYVAADRFEASQIAMNEGASHLLYDDGAQNPSLIYNTTIFVVDGGYGFGNNKLMPAGPLREPVETAMARCQAVIIIGDDEFGVKYRVPADVKVLSAKILSDEAKIPDLGEKYFAFAGIGRPAKFYKSCKEAGLNLVDAQDYADHYYYTESDIAELMERAKFCGAKLITTEKDKTRIPLKFHEHIQTLPITIQFENMYELKNLLPQVPDAWNFSS